MKIIAKRLFLFLLVVLISFSVYSQDPLRYKDDVAKLVQKEYRFTGNKELVVFAGSSSIRMWHDVEEYFPGFHVINNGFGGSHFTDLIYYYNELILKHQPDYLFIYEGDNDIAGKKKPAKVIKHAKKLYRMIQQDLPGTKVVFISPKPSIARVHLKKEYEDLNARLEKFCQKQSVGFADVWTSMVDENGDVSEDLFIKDGLHLNKKGYDIWGKVISTHLN
ncbi:MAG: GDSL-type esterase/lipase family protein [Mariniphaga sp.]